MKIFLTVFALTSSCVGSHPEGELVVRISGGPLVAQLLAQENGHFYKGPVMGFSDTYVLIPWKDTIENHQKRGLHSERIVNDNRVLWAEEQHVKSRQKRDFVVPGDPSDIPKERVKRFEEMRRDEEEQHVKSRQKRDFVVPGDPSDIPKERVKRFEEMRRDDEEQHVKSRQKRDFVVPGDPSDIPKERVKRYEELTRVYKKPMLSSSDKTFNDELWSQQWYLRDTRSRVDLPKLDLNVLPVYRAGITGKGVRISILDDGIEYTHDDLKGNYDPDISWDCNEDDNDPYPRYEHTNSNSHGTRCAGEVAMVANNGKCGVGIAFNAKFGGVKMLDGFVTDRIEGTALSYAQDLVDIYSASWGPNDDGKTVDGPGRLATESIKRGIEEGRGGKGTIYVWASGNGGNNNDNCNCDGYLSSAYTISIGSASQKGEFPWYGEACASTLAVTYSSGAYKDQMIATTDLQNECTTKHTGTSASAPLAAGIIALALEAKQQTVQPMNLISSSALNVVAQTLSPSWNPFNKKLSLKLRRLSFFCSYIRISKCLWSSSRTSKTLAYPKISLQSKTESSNLTWRDVQHLIVWTSELAPLVNNRGWQQNSAGFWFNDRFGFGLMNAFGLITAASTWTMVPERKTCEVHLAAENRTLSADRPVEILIHSEGCRGSEQEIIFLEHVELRISINYTVRGVLQIFLVSPTGTQVKLLAPRKLDKSDKGFVDWTFMSVMTWGESAEGVWMLLVTDTSKNGLNHGMVGESRLILHGTYELPFHMKDGPRNYNQNYNRIQNRVKTPRSRGISDAIYEDNYEIFKNNRVRNVPFEYFRRDLFK